MRAYQLYLKRNLVAWEWIGTLDAATHAQAFAAALSCLGPGDETRPIRVEQDVEGAYRKPIRPPHRPHASARPALARDSRRAAAPAQPATC